MPSFRILTFGCKVNFYESEAIREKLLARGLIESDSLKADYFVVNTCAVTSTAEKKCLQTVRKISRNNPNCKIGVVGCSSQISLKEYQKIPNVYAVRGNSFKSLITDDLFCDSPIVEVKSSIRNETFDRQSVQRFGHGVRAYCKIQDGCDNFCSYCVIPQTRGNSRSRPLPDVLDEIATLIENGYREIVLTGIDMGSYFYEKFDFDRLLKSILETFEGRVRFRIGSLEESQISDKTIALFSIYGSTLVPHLHIPLQSGSPTILQAMHRKYDLDNFLTLSKKLKRRLPGLALSTDVIVGFPSEDEKMFMETYRFIERVGFMRLHVFPFSPRPHTLAATCQQVAPSVKNERVKRLIELNETLRRQYLQSSINKTHRLLIEEKIGSNRYRGYTENYLEVEVESSSDILGQIIDVKFDDQLQPLLV